MTQQVKEVMWIGITGIALVLAGLALRSYWNERVDRIQLDAELKTTERLLQAKDQELSRLDQGMKERDQQTAEMVKKIDELKARRPQFGRSSAKSRNTFPSRSRWNSSRPIPPRPRLRLRLAWMSPRHRI